MYILFKKAGWFDEYLEKEEASDKMREELSKWMNDL